MNRPPSPFWKEKSLQELSPEEWESLCDGCARCCLHKFIDDDGRLLYSSVVCRYLDIDKCQCTCYEQRSIKVPDCVIVKPENIDELDWMPSSCAYRLLNEGKELPDWHPLVSGDPNSVHEAGISVRHFAVSEDEVDDPEYYIIDSGDQA